LRTLLVKRRTTHIYSFHRSGNFGFDPLGVYPKNEKAQKAMQLSEIKNGRLAMIAITAFAVQELVTGSGVVDATPRKYLNDSSTRTLVVKGTDSHTTPSHFLVAEYQSFSNLLPPSCTNTPTLDTSLIKGRLFCSINLTFRTENNKRIRFFRSSSDLS
jgi:hypothetical protein